MVRTDYWKNFLGPGFLLLGHEHSSVPLSKSVFVFGRKPAAPAGLLDEQVHTGGPPCIPLGWSI